MPTEVSCSMVMAKSDENSLGDHALTECCSVAEEEKQMFHLCMGSATQIRLISWTYVTYHVALKMIHHDETFFEICLRGRYKFILLQMAMNSFLTYQIKILSEWLHFGVAHALPKLLLTLMTNHCKIRTSWIMKLNLKIHFQVWRCFQHHYGFIRSCPMCHPLNQPLNAAHV